MEHGMAPHRMQRRDQQPYIACVCAWACVCVRVCGESSYVWCVCVCVCVCVYRALRVGTSPVVCAEGVFMVD